ncbi:DUF6095 family protein [Flavobacteriaceae bacterium]|nr:DUF6095 family protein [Flavobacteriaceae bacterium]MDB2631868.1 DUF6095 family protein [Flavobacteriaceae bacterium]
MEPKRTNRPLLVKGLKTMGLTLLTLFLGPFLLHVGLSNPDKPFYIPLVIAGIGICGLAIYLGFKGIKIIMDSIFK